jgi:ubiquinone biosynthesis protein
VSKTTKKLRKQDEDLKAANSERAVNVFMQMLALVPDDDRQQELLTLVMDEARLTNPGSFREQILALLAPLDLQAHREEIVRLLLELIPIEELVPTVYEKYKPLVVDAGNIILSQLSNERLRIKLVEQLLLPFEAAVHERLFRLITRMPTLQKIGQIIARNHNIDPKFRKLLQTLENSIRDATYESIFERVHQELKSQIQQHKIKLGPRFVAEASVCAVIPFTWQPPAGERQRGVFKVLKPFIAKYWAEELHIMDALATYFDKRRNHYGLPTMGFRDVLKEVRDLFKREVKLQIEQGQLQAASDFYAQDQHVRIPRLLPMRTATLTSMEFVKGTKVTTAAQRNPERSQRIASLILDKLIVSILFYEQEDALFHADPHAGNLFYDPEKDELIILDWGLSCNLKRSTRREIVQLLMGFILGDRQRAYQAASKLTEGRLTRTQQESVQGKVDEIFDTLPRFPLVRLEPLTKLLDDLILSGIRFPAELLMFRKSIFTLMGVIHDTDPRFDIDWQLTRALFEQIIHELPSRLVRSPWSRDYPSQLTTWELRDAIVKLSQIAAQLGIENRQLLIKLGLEKAQAALLQFSQSLRRPLITAKSEV